MARAYKRKETSASADVSFFISIVPNEVSYSSTGFMVV